jgi:dynein heavy chain
MANPADDWLIEKGWVDVLNLARLKAFAGFDKDFGAHVAHYREYFDSEAPHRHPLPQPWQDRLSPFQKLLVLRCLRVDKMEEAVQEFVELNMGRRFIEPPTFNLEESFRGSSPTSPMIFVLSPGMQSVPRDSWFCV